MQYLYIAAGPNLVFFDQIRDCEQVSLYFNSTLNVVTKGKLNKSNCPVITFLFPAPDRETL